MLLTARAGRGRRSPPRHAVPRQHLAHRFDHPLLRHRELGLGLLAQIVVALLGEARKLGADDQVLDLSLTPREH